MENTYLDKLFETQKEIIYKKELGEWKAKMKKANDKEYAHKIFLSRQCEKIDLRLEKNPNYMNIINIMRSNYQLGESMEDSIKEVRKKGTPPSKLSHDEKKEVKTRQERKQNFEWDEMTDEELTCLFAELKAQHEIVEYMKSGRLLEEASKPAPKSERDKEEENITQDKDSIKAGTTSQQTLIFYYLFEYLKIDVNAKIKADFIQFLTGKSWDNIYKKVLRPLNQPEASLRKDLKVVRDFFDSLELKEVKKLVEKELQC